jgi:outer membrane lipoprotein LolB
MRARNPNDSQGSSWHGRLSLRVQADANTGQKQDQSFSAAFELHGNTNEGELQFFTPLGSTAADIRWSRAGAVLKARGEVREFGNLAQLITDLLGTDIPVTALFAWLDGQPQDAEGWEVDLSQRPQGKIQAHRNTPTPAADLRVLLDD